MRAFLEDAAQQLSRLEGAIADQDATLLGRCAHALKSSSANLGAEELAALYRRLEAFARNDQVGEARALLHELRLAHANVVRRANEILEEAA